MLEVIASLRNYHGGCICSLRNVMVHMAYSGHRGPLFDTRSRAMGEAALRVFSNRTNRPVSGGVRRDNLPSSFEDNNTDVPE